MEQNCPWCNEPVVYGSSSCPICACSLQYHKENIFFPIFRVVRKVLVSFILLMIIVVFANSALPEWVHNLPFKQQNMIFYTEMFIAFFLPFFIVSRSEYKEYIFMSKHITFLVPENYELFDDIECPYCDYYIPFGFHECTCGTSLSYKDGEIKFCTPSMKEAKEERLKKLEDKKEKAQRIREEKNRKANAPITCQYCGTSINRHASVCPGCQAEKGAIFWTRHERY